ncbi:MAG: glycosyltransferase family 2 protein [Phycisphaerales bacterium]
MTTPPSPAMPTRYAIVAPCRDEAAYMRRTLDSLLNQTIQPALLLVVDDGSTDDTPKILAEYQPKMPYLRVLTRSDRGKRAVGPGVIEAFYAGLDTITMDEFDFIVKLDLDLDIPNRYFEIMCERMAAQPRLGTCSGKPYFPHPSTGQLVSEGCGDEMSVGMIKFYRVECFKQIGGFVREVMWDGIDCHRCRMLGWIAASWDEPDIRFTHLRPMGSSQQSIWKGRTRHGFGQWFMGTSFSYMTASAIFRLPKHPVLIGGLAMWWGYIKSALTAKPRYNDLEFRKFLRAYQRDALIHGKAAATRSLNERQASRWNPKGGTQRKSEDSQRNTKG